MMRIDRENLRIDLSQPQAIWAIFGAAAAIYGVLFLLETVGGWNGGPAALTWSWGWAQAFLLGIILVGAGGRPKATMTSFSFTLPGYRESLRRSSLGRAVRVGVAFSLVLFSNTWYELHMHADWPLDRTQPLFAVGPAVPELSLSVIGGFLAGMAICLLWIAGGVVMAWRTWLAVSFLGMGAALGRVAWIPASKHPFAIWPVLIPLSVLACAYLWWCLGDMAWVKNGHRAILLYRMNVAKGGTVSSIASWVEEFFLHWMRRSGSTSRARRLWGWLYQAFGPALTRWKRTVMSLLIGALVLGYLNRFFVGVGFVHLGLYIAGSVWLASSDMPLPEGRREKCYLTIAAAVLATLLLVGVSVGIIVLSLFFAAVLPPVSLGPFYLQYAGFSIRNVWLACLPVPWFTVVAIVLALLLLCVQMVWPFMILLTLAFLAGVLSVGRGIPHLRVGPALLPVLLACGWAFFLLTTWITYTRRDLADGGSVEEDDGGSTEED